jgi:hypothetical protein
MHWFVISWLDVMVNTAALSLVPGFTAFLGGHLAAEVVPERNKKTAWRVAFFALFVLSVVLTGWQQVRASASEFERSTADDWVRALLIRTLFRPVLPPSFAYLKTPKPIAAPAQRVPPQTISAPNGIAVGGNAHVENPTVNNNYGDREERVLTEGQLSQIIQRARLTPTHVIISFTSNDDEAFNLAKQIHDALVQAGWSVEPGISPILIMGQPQVGILLTYKGEKPTGPQTYLSGTSPQLSLAQSFAAANLIYYAQPLPDMKENEVRVTVNSAPRRKRQQ